MGILKAIAAAMSMLDHLWQAYNSSGMVQRKLAQMTEDEKNQHSVLVDQAMHGNVEQRKAALEEIQKLVAE